MKLSAQQLAQFEGEGFLVFPELFSQAEIDVLRAETARLCAVEAVTVIRERSGGVRISFNACANAPQFGPASRPDWVVSRNTLPLPREDDAGILNARTATNNVFA